MAPPTKQRIIRIRPLDPVSRRSSDAFRACATVAKSYREDCRRGKGIVPVHGGVRLPVIVVRRLPWRLGRRRQFRPASAGRPARRRSARCTLTQCRAWARVVMTVWPARIRLAACSDRALQAAISSGLMRLAARAGIPVSVSIRQTVARRTTQFRTRPRCSGLGPARTVLSPMTASRMQSSWLIWTFASTFSMAATGAYPRRHFSDICLLTRKSQEAVRRD